MTNPDKRKKISPIIGQYLKNLREKRHLTQAQASELIGVSQPSIFYYENATRLPSTDVITKYANAFNEDPDSILRLREATIFETVELLGDETPWQIKNERNMIAHGWRPFSREPYESKEKILKVSEPSVEFLNYNSKKNQATKDKIKIQLTIDESGRVKLNNKDINIDELDKVLEDIRHEAQSKNKTEQ